MIHPLKHLVRLLAGVAALLALRSVALADTLYVSAHTLPVVDPTGLTNAIYRVTPDGAVTTAFKGRMLPEGVAFDAQNRLFLANNGTGFIDRLAGGSLVQFGAKISDPYGIAFDSLGNLYVASSALGKVFKIAPGGATSALATFTAPFGLAVDKADALFVADPGVASIYKIAPGGVKTLFAAGLPSPQCLAFDAGGNLFVSTFGGVIYKLAPSGARTTFASGISMALGLAFDTAGNLYVASFDTGLITKITPAGAKRTFATIPKSSPKFIAILPDPPAVPGPLAVLRGNDSVVLSWSGTFTLQTSPSLGQPFADMAGTTSPFTNQTSQPAAFFRLRN